VSSSTSSAKTLKSSPSLSKTTSFSELAVAETSPFIVTVLSAEMFIEATALPVPFVETSTDISPSTKASPLAFIATVLTTSPNLELPCFPTVIFPVEISKPSISTLPRVLISAVSTLP
jgi:hypothetical protein